MKRVFLVVLDSLGIGAQPDSFEYGDAGCNTLRSVCSSEKCFLPNLQRMGLFNIRGIDFGTKEKSPIASYCRLLEQSRGKDSTVGHWELAGLISKTPFPTYPNGFPAEIISLFEEKTGRRVLCNRPYSGTQVIENFGKEHIESGALIVYTSADSVFQIAAHEDVVPVQTLYEYCLLAREMLVGEHGVGRVIARPFVGKWPDFLRTANRRDFSLTPPSETLLDRVSSSGLDVISVGKIKDIFAGKGITRAIKTESNKEGTEKLKALVKEDFSGFCAVNLVDFDTVYGHRNDVDGYAAALSAFDAALGNILPDLSDDDALIITADHGCDPLYEGTDHTREYVPFLLYGKSLPKRDLGEGKFSDLSATVSALLNIPSLVGKDLLGE